MSATVEQLSCSSAALTQYQRGLEAGLAPSCLPWLRAELSFWVKLWRTILVQEDRPSSMRERLLAFYQHQQGFPSTISKIEKSVPDVKTLAPICFVSIPMCKCLCTLACMCCVHTHS